MKKVIIAPDSFKETMSAKEACGVIKACIEKYVPEAEIHCIPMSDGGEGMVEAYLSICGGQRVFARVSGPLGESVDAEYGLLPDYQAVMEMAACAGLPLVGDRKNPMEATTFGVGEMLRDAERRGVKHVMMGLGGSATNDCGIGMAAALGYVFLDDGGRTVEPKAYNLSRIAHIRKPKKRMEIRITAAYDVSNPLYGETGAAYTFGGQKGANDAMIRTLDFGLEHMAAVIERELGTDFSRIPGAGAAGGLGAGLIAFAGAALKPGIELLLDAAKFDDLLEGASVVFTGEGRIDWQSTYGKVPVGVARRARAKGVPCIALCGSTGRRVEEVYEHGMTSVFSAINHITDFEGVKETCRADLELLTDSVLRTIMAKIQ